MMKSGGRLSRSHSLPALSPGLMITLYHHPFCPHSRFIRLVLGEMGIEPRLVEERAWDRRREFLLMAPEGATPVMLDDETPSLSGAEVIAEYLDETRGLGLGDRRLMPNEPLARAETRRLMHWFNWKLFNESSQWLVREKVNKRFMSIAQGGGAPDMQAVRAARANVRYHLRYIEHLSGARNWLAGDRLTYADLAAAAHLSCIDYLGDAQWDENEIAKTWYARMKSRPSFRPLLAERLPGMMPSVAYADLDF
jgi:glutathione S-transferase